ncbi:MAG: hypothetical protein WAL67_10920 [Candidatus Cybelea sp.]
MQQKCNSGTIFVSSRRASGGVRRVSASVQREVAISEGHRRNRRWARENPGQHDEAWFEREIAQRLDIFTLREIAAAIGLSLAACSRIRAGTETPHPRHWNALLTLIVESPNASRPSATGRRLSVLRGGDSWGHWAHEHPGQRDEAWFKREVALKLDGFSLKEIGKATGLSLATCSRIRAGTKIPHPRLWDSLCELEES